MNPSLYFLSTVQLQKGMKNGFGECLAFSQHQPSTAQNGNFYVFVIKTCSYDVQMIWAPFDCGLLLLGHILL